jgi:hypothetical protein
MLRLTVIGTLLLTAALVLATSFAGAPAAAAGLAQPRWAWPVLGTREILRPFIAPTTKYSAGHRGIDIAASGFAYAPADGVVHFAGVVADVGVLSISHPGNVLSSYEPVSSTLVAGQPVSRGEVIATLQPGHCTQPCLHFGVRVDGEYVSPMLFLGGIPHSILLPTGRLATAMLPAAVPPHVAVRRGDARFGSSPSAAQPTHACKAGSFRGWRDRASPVPSAGRHLRRGGAWPPYDEACADRRA